MVESTEQSRPPKINIAHSESLELEELKIEPKSAGHTQASLNKMNGALVKSQNQKPPVANTGRYSEKKQSKASPSSGVSKGSNQNKLSVDGSPYSR